MSIDAVFAERKKGYIEQMVHTLKLPVKSITYVFTDALMKVPIKIDGLTTILDLLYTHQLIVSCASAKICLDIKLQKNKFVFPLTPQLYIVWWLQEVIRRSYAGVLEPEDVESVFNKKECSFV